MLWLIYDFLCAITFCCNLESKTSKSQVVISEIFWKKSECLKKGAFPIIRSPLQDKKEVMNSKILYVMDDILMLMC